MYFYRVIRASLAVGCAALASLWTSSALAQNQTFVLDRLLPPGAPDDGIVLPRAVTQPDTIIFAQLGYGIQVNPLRTRTVVNSTDDKPIINAQSSFIRQQMSWYPTIGAEFFNRVIFSVSFPFYYTDGANPPYNLGKVSSGQNATFVQANKMGMGDTNIDLRGVIWRTPNERFAIGASLGMIAPTGNQTDGFAGDGITNWKMGIMAEYDFKYFVLGGSTGLQLGRGKHTINAPESNSGLGVGDEWRWAIGAFVPFKGGKFRVGLNVMGQIGIQSDNSCIGGTGVATSCLGDTFNTKRNFPWEISAEGRMKLGPKERFWVGVSIGSAFGIQSYGAPDFRGVVVGGFYFPILESSGSSPDAKLAMRERWKSERGLDSDKDGIPDDIDACPADPEDHLGNDPNDGCPIPPDRDNDGIPDMYDKCPDTPEDKDGIQDGDGCPEDDGDQDGVADAVDACPKEPGKPSPDPKVNGCPSFIKLDEETGVIRILQQVHFQTGSANILPDSFPMLEEIVKLLKANLQIKRMSIEGHTDNVGAEQMNLTLSRDRAASVMKWIVDHGVDQARLESHGYGMTKPLPCPDGSPPNCNSNATDAGRAKNRRVEFKILQQDDPNKYQKK